MINNKKKSGDGVCEDDQRGPFALENRDSASWNEMLTKKYLLSDIHTTLLTRRPFSTPRTEGYKKIPLRSAILVFPIVHTTAIGNTKKAQHLLLVDFTIESYTINRVRNLCSPEIVIQEKQFPITIWVTLSRLRSVFWKMHNSILRSEFWKMLKLLILDTLRLTEIAQFLQLLTCPI